MYIYKAIGFLDNKKIHDAVGVAQEVLHNIKMRWIQSMILKLDVVKAYDRVDWGFLRLILL